MNTNNALITIPPPPPPFTRENTETVVLEKLKKLWKEGNERTGIPNYLYDKKVVEAWMPMARKYGERFEWFIFDVVFQYGLMVNALKSITLTGKKFDVLHKGVKIRSDPFDPLGTVVELRIENERVPAYPYHVIMVFKRLKPQADGSYVIDSGSPNAVEFPEFRASPLYAGMMVGAYQDFVKKAENGEQTIVLGLENMSLG